FNYRTLTDSVLGKLDRITDFYANSGNDFFLVTNFVLCKVNETRFLALVLLIVIAYKLLRT
ncbi:MAG: hypothetical protein ACKPKT_24220, partial [Dolichospermum sp.]